MAAAASLLLNHIPMIIRGHSTIYHSHMGPHMPLRIKTGVTIHSANKCAAPIVYHEPDKDPGRR